MKDQLDKCPLEGDLPDGTCKYVGRAHREGYGALCKQHDYRLSNNGSPYATTLSPDSREPTYDLIMQRRAHGDLDRNA